MNAHPASLAAQARALLGRVQEIVLAGSPAALALSAAGRRLDEPLRVAIAGRSKTGKSTLLNSLIGEELAPTDASECTRVVTWYRAGTAYRVTLTPLDGGNRVLRFSREGGALDIDLDDVDLDQIARLDVEWPCASLQALTLIDTPGIASLSLASSARTTALLAPSDGVPEADAVIYLLRHVHHDDVELLDSFHGDVSAHSSPAAAVGVLARADEIGGGRLDALGSARVVAARLRRDPVVRRLCRTVVPVAGLLAQGGAGLREVDVHALAQLAALPGEAVADLTLSVDRFVADRRSVPVPPLIRSDLLERLGLFGIRLSLSLLGEGRATTASSLSAALVASSGLPELWEVLQTTFATRAGVLKARSAIRAVEVALRQPGAEHRGLEVELERLLANDHELAELRLLDGLRLGGLELDEAEVADAERLLGCDGQEVCQRLALEGEVSGQDIRRAAVEAAARWQDRAEHPLSSRAVVDAARVVVRTCEGMAAGVPPR